MASLVYIALSAFAFSLFNVDGVSTSPLPRQSRRIRAHPFQGRFRVGRSNQLGLDTSIEGFDYDADSSDDFHLGLQSGFGSGLGTGFDQSFDNQFDYGSGGFNQGAAGGSDHGASGGFLSNFIYSCQEGEVLNVDGKCAVPVVSKNVFLYDAPHIEPIPSPPPIVPRPKVDYNIVFVRTPKKPQLPDPLVIPPPNQKTLVYVLSETPQLQQQVIEVPEGPPQNPDVFYLNYNQNDNPTLPGGVTLQEILTSLQREEEKVLSGSLGQLAALKFGLGEDDNIGYGNSLSSQFLTKDTDFGNSLNTQFLTQNLDFGNPLRNKFVGHDTNEGFIQPLKNKFLAQDADKDLEKSLRNSLLKHDAQPPASVAILPPSSH